MPNITLSIDEKTLKAGRLYARRHHQSLNAMIRELLSKRALSSSCRLWVKGYYHYLDKLRIPKVTTKIWRREELYRV